MSWTAALQYVYTVSLCLYPIENQRLDHTSVERGGHKCGVSGTQVWNKSHTSVEQTPFKYPVFDDYNLYALRC